MHPEISRAQDDLAVKVLSGPPSSSKEIMHRKSTGNGNIQGSKNMALGTAIMREIREQQEKEKS
jgi:hypothetical protein